MDTSTNSSSALKTTDQLLHEAADTFLRKNAEYGENFRSFPEVMMSMFPQGITLGTYEDWMRLQFFMLNVVKMTRYAQNFKLGGHADSARDMAVYSAMMEATDAEFAYFNANRQPKQPDGNNRG